MADLSVAHRTALAQLIEGVPDRTRQTLAVAVAAMPGDRARVLESMLAEAARNRTRRDRGLGALAPMFAPRADGVAAVSFPPAVLPRLWKIVAAGQADLMPYLDPRIDYHEDAYRIGAVCARLSAAAAAAVRDQPDVIWPLAFGLPEGGPEGREAALQALAHACDLGGLAHRALASLRVWIDRPDGDQVAELRLLLRDAAAISPNGTQELLEILFAHLKDAPLVLRLVVHASPAAAHDSFLSRSELAIFVDRLLDAAEVRAARVATFRIGEAVDAVAADLNWIAQLLNEVDTTVHIRADSPWGQRIRKLRLGVSRSLGQLLGRVARLIDQVLPMTRVQVGGPARRSLPDLAAQTAPEVVDQAGAALDLVKATRTLAPVFGCDAQRQALMNDLTGQLISYADLVLEAIHAGEASEAGEGSQATARANTAAVFLERLDRVDEGRAVRRRVAVAALSIKGASPKAA